MSKNPQTKFPKPGKDESPQKYPGLEKEMNIKPNYDNKSYSGSNKLNGKVALITGGDSGIGRSVAVTYAKEGADVAITYLADEKADAEVVEKQIKKTGQKCLLIEADFRDLNSCEEVIDKIVSQFGRLDILVNNAAIQRNFENLQSIKAEDFEEIYRVNVVAPFELSKLAVEHMQPGSSIINTVSIQAFDPSFILLPYAASKGAFTELTKGLASCLIDKGIRVNAIAPGPIWSPLNTHASPKSKLKKFGESTAIGRPGQPIELAPVYILLASDEASYITGEIYGITGGSGIV